MTTNQWLLGGETSNVFYVHPDSWGKWSNLTIMFFRVETTTQVGKWHVLLGWPIFMGWIASLSGVYLFKWYLSIRRGAIKKDELEMQQPTIHGGLPSISSFARCQVENVFFYRNGPTFQSNWTLRKYRKCTNIPLGWWVAGYNPPKVGTVFLVARSHFTRWTNTKIPILRSQWYLHFQLYPDLSVPYGWK